MAPAEVVGMETGSNGRGPAWAALVKALEDPDPKVRASAAEALGKMEGKPTARKKRPKVVPLSGSGGAIQKLQDSEMTDYGNAERLVAMVSDPMWGPRYRWVQQRGKWIAWDGKRWADDETLGIEQQAKLTVRATRVAAVSVGEERRKGEILEWAKASESKSRLHNMIELARSEPSVPITIDRLDARQDLLNTQSGVVDLRSGKLLAHSMHYFCTKITNASYDQYCGCPAWDRFLSEIMGGDEDLISYLKRAVGYSLTADVSEHCLFFLHGTGRNGKSTFVETIRHMLGGYSQKADFSMFLEKKNDQVSNDIARLCGIRMVASVEPKRGRRFEESIIKELTGGDTRTARFLYGEFFDYPPTEKIWLAANHKPVIKGTDEGIWSRIHLIPFTKFIEPGKRDPHLRDKLDAELGGILRWAVEGCLEWQSEGLSPPPQVLAAGQEYREEMDVIGRFVREECVEEPECKVLASELYSSYAAWCDMRREHPLSANAFGRELGSRGYERKHLFRGETYLKLGLRDKRHVEEHATN